jgi:hypothetical protein
MQTYAEPALTDTEGRALWLSLFQDVKAQQLMAPSLPRTLARLMLLFALLAAALLAYAIPVTLLGPYLAA